MSHKILKVVVTLVLIAAGRAEGEPDSEHTASFYVATNGRDTWSGTLPVPDEQKSDGPFATLVRARNAIRQLKQRNELARPIQVMIRGGTYFLDDTLVFTPDDSGTKDCPLTYAAYPNGCRRTV